MKSAEQKRDEILKGMFELRGQTFRMMGIKWSWKNSSNSWDRRRYEAGMNTFYPINDLHEIILHALEIEPKSVTDKTEQYRGRKVHLHYEHYSNEQRKICDQIIWNMKVKGYIELRCVDTERNTWQFKILRTR